MVGRRVRYFEIKRVVDEFEALSRMGFSVICIVDDLFTANKARCMEIATKSLAGGSPTSGRLSGEWTRCPRNCSAGSRRLGVWACVSGSRAATRQSSTA